MVKLIRFNEIKLYLFIEITLTINTTLNLVSMRFSDVYIYYIIIPYMS